MFSQVDGVHCTRVDVMPEQAVRAATGSRNRWSGSERGPEEVVASTIKSCPGEVAREKKTEPTSTWTPSDQTAARRATFRSSAVGRSFMIFIYS